MNVWLEEAIRILKLLVRKPDTPVEIIVTSLLVLIVFLIIMWLGGLAFKMPDANLMQRILSGALVAAVGVAAATAVSILAAPRIEKEIVQQSLMIAVPAVAIVLIGIPLAMLVMRAKYFQTLFTVVLSMAAAWGVSLLSETVFDSVRQGIKQAEKTSARKVAADEIMDGAGKGAAATNDPRGYKIYRSKRDIENQKRDEERAAAEKAAREKAIRDRFK
jgi:hypothetical protein